MNSRLFILLSLLMACLLNINAATYYIDPAATINGNEIFRNDVDKFIVGQTAFADFATFASSNPEANSIVYVAPGTYSTAATIKTAGLTFLGNNAYQDWAKARNSESIITAQINIEASNIEINGFKITGNGRIASTTGTNESPLSGIKLTYNYITGSTLARHNSKQAFQIGVRYTNATAVTTTAQCRYKDCEVSHNFFEGDATHYPACIGLSGIYGTTKVIDNKFIDGGTSVWINNAQGNIQVQNNVFKEVGKTTITAPDGGNLGDFCVALYYSAFANSTTLDVRNNEFDGCYGQGSTYSLIRVYQGTADNLVTPLNCTVKIQRNAFKNKTQVHASNNYLLYIDKGNGAAIKTDIRDNTFDHNGYELAWINGSGLATSVRDTYYGNNYNLITPSECTFGTYQSEMAPGGVKIIQSFDVDHETGDIYFTQLDNNAAQATMKTNYGDPGSVLLTKYDKSAGKNYTMQLAWSGHGTKVTVCRHNGKLYVFTGRATTINSAGDETVSTGTAWFEFVSGAVVDCRKSSFTHGGKTYPVYSFEDNGKTDEYPYIDEVSRLFVTRGKQSGHSYYRIYNLDSFLADPANATPIKTCKINKSSNPTSTTGDKGYNTWYFQSYAVNGDYIYFLEGVSAVDANALNAKPTVFIHAYNWRTNEFKYRVQLKNSALLNLTYGEPEGITVRRNSSGTAEILVGMANGAVGARKAIIYKYTPSNSKTVALSNATHTASVSSIDLTSSDGAAVTSTFTITNKNLHGDVFAHIFGKDQSQFKLTVSQNGFENETTTVKVTYTPDEEKPEASASIRISSPLGNNIIIPLNGTYPSATVEPPTITANPANFTLSGEHGSTEVKCVDVKITAANLQQDMTVNSSSGVVSVTKQADWNARTGGTIRCTLNTNFSLGAGTYDKIVAVQSGSSSDPHYVRLEIPYTATLTEASVTPGPEPDQEISINTLTEQWIYSTNKGNLADASYFASATPYTRDMCYANGKLYVLNSGGDAPVINIIDAYTGKATGNTLSTAGITSGGPYGLASIKALGNTIIGCAMCGAAGTLTIYKWSSDTADPEVWFTSADHGSVEVGRSMNTSGDMNNGAIAFGAYDATNKVTTVVSYVVVNGTVNASPKVIALGDMGGVNSNFSVYPMADGSFWMDNKDKLPVHYNADGTIKSQLSADIAGQQYGVAIKAFTYGKRNYVAFTSTLGSTASAAWGNGVLRLVNVTNEASPVAVGGTYPEAGLGEASSWGGNVGFNAVDYEITSDNLNLWVMVPYQGIAMYQFKNTPSGIDDTLGTSLEAMPVEWYNLQGVRVDGENLVPGIYISRQGNDVKKVLVK